MSAIDEQIQKLAETIISAAEFEAQLLSGEEAGEIDAALVAAFGQTYAGQVLAMMRDLCAQTAVIAKELGKLGIRL